MILQAAKVLRRDPVGAGRYRDEAGRQGISTWPWRLLAAALLLVGVGLFALWCVSPPVTEAGRSLVRSFFFRQVLFVTAGLAGMAAMNVPSYGRFRSAAFWIYALTILALVAVLFLARPVRGVRSWFAVGPFTVQPAELAKLALILALARFLAHEKNRREPWRLGVLLALVGIPAVLVLRQPDLGTTIVFVPVTLAMMWAAGVSRRLLVGVLVVLAVAAPAGYFLGMKPYQRYRIQAFLAPDKVPPEFRYQQEHAIRATAGGGAVGLGLGESSASYPFYIPDRHTDFIFSVIGEEFGFVGCMIVVLLYALLLYELFRIAWHSQEPFGRLVVVGTAAAIWTQVVISIGMTVGVMPITGLTLPFVSYGGSSLVVSLLLVGLATNVARRRVVTFLTRGPERARIDG